MFEREWGPVRGEGRGDGVDWVSGAVGCGDRVGVGEIGGLNEGVCESFLAEVDGEMIVGLAYPGEFNAKEVSDLPHKINVGERGEMLFKSYFAISRRAEMHEVVHIVTK